MTQAALSAGASRIGRRRAIIELHRHADQAAERYLTHFVQAVLDSAQLRISTGEAGEERREGELA